MIARTGFRTLTRAACQATALSLSLTLGISSQAQPATTSSAAATPAEESQNDSLPVPKATPLVKWTFEGKEPGQWQGAAKILAEGPQLPIFPDFAKGNKATVFQGKDAAIRVQENDLPGVNLRFTNGEAITLEAWVNTEALNNGNYIYLIGKGRNQNKAFSHENQNWALRLKGEGGEARPCFLFRSRNAQGKEGYHRWVAKEGFLPGTSWHHVAVTYTFGKPDSIIAWVDGKKIKTGTWDLDAKTTEPPVSDSDDIMIGTGNGGGAGNTLNGALDEIAIYRQIVPDALLAQRYQIIPPPPALEAKDVPAGKVLVQICDEGVPAKNAWPTFPPTVTETYLEDVFGIFETPQKYISTGVRGDRPIPYLLRAGAVVELPAGKHRLLLRGRGASHLHVDGKQLLTTPFPVGDTGGHGHVAEQKDWLDLGPDFRFAPPGNGESWCEFETKGGKHLFILEQMVGGVAGNSRRRPELGETVVAISLEGSQSWKLVSPGKREVNYTDAGWNAYEATQRVKLDQMNQERRAKARSAHSTYWTLRRAAAEKWLASNPAPEPPALPAGYPAYNAIDHFLGDRIAKVAAQKTASATGTVDYFRDIQPMLESNCYSCHQGSKVKGGLKLDSLAAALIGGDSDGAAVTPGKPEASALLTRVISTDEELVMPPKGHPLTAAQADLLRRWIQEGAHWPDMNVSKTTLTGLSDDYAFLRRVSVDTIGVPPTLEEVEAFAADKSPNKRAAAIDRLLDDPRWADRWMGYWQDVLAENPNILNPTLNNSGPFRWFIYESLLDDKPMDLFVTELLRMEGSERFGGPAGFGTASQNDVPMAAKGTIVSTAFLGVEMKCARCHDSPAHKSSQEDLFALGALMEGKALEVPLTSSVPMDKLHEGGRKPLIQVTLKPGTKVEPAWPFGEFGDVAEMEKLAETPTNTRDRLAALVTAPQNERFAQVMANRIWQQFMGRGIVEPADDWEKGSPTHPELLQWLGREFVRGGYSMKNLSRVILNSHAYQRATDADLQQTSPLYTSPAPRRLGAEQIVDSLFAATGKPFNLEEVSLDIDGRRDLKNSISLGKPSRSWMLTSTSNERDRPSLSLPRNQAVCDVLAAFGWRGARQDPLTVRETAPNALQPAILSNGTVGIWLTRLSEDHGITALALEDQSVDVLVDKLYLKLLTRKPTAEEKERLTDHLRDGYEQRLTQAAPLSAPRPERPVKFVSWSNHLDPEATVVRMEEEVAARRGDPATARLTPEWRQRLEDVLWAMLNSPEWIYTP